MKVEEVYLVNKSWRCFGSNISAIHLCCSARSTALNAIWEVHRWWWVSIVSDCLGWVGGGLTRWGAEGGN